MRSTLFKQKQILLAAGLSKVNREAAESIRLYSYRLCGTLLACRAQTPDDISVIQDRGPGSCQQRRVLVGLSNADVRVETNLFKGSHRASLPS